MKQVRAFLIPEDWVLNHRRVKITPSIKLAGTHLYTWAERDIVRVKCFAKNTTQCVWPGLEPGPLDPEMRALV